MKGAAQQPATTAKAETPQKPEQEKKPTRQYVCPKGEEQFYHVVLERKRFDQETGERLSKPFLQKYGKKEFETSLKRRFEALGYTVTIVHDPTE